MAETTEMGEAIAALERAKAWVSSVKQRSTAALHAGGVVLTEGTDPERVEMYNAIGAPARAGDGTEEKREDRPCP